MKLEAMNGNLMSLTVKVPPAEEGDVMDTEGSEEQQPPQQQQQPPQPQQQAQEGEGGDKEVGVVGKKKGTRKKRSLNWEEAERCLLVEVIKSKVDYVENRNVDAKSIKAKRLAWMQITKQFNALNFRHRSLEQIQVQWRSMKNSAKREYQQKNPKAGSLEGMDMLEFMEELQKDPTNTRSQTRGNGVVIKKELLEIDDEDTPLAALPTSTNTSEDTLQTSTIALPSPPPSAESQNDAQHQTTPTRQKKRTLQSAAQKQQQIGHSAGTPGAPAKQRKQRMQTSSQSDGSAPASANDVQSPNFPHTTPTVNTPISATLPPSIDDKLKRQLFELMKRERLAEMDYTRREHEQRIRFESMEKEMKLNYYRQHEELKLQQLREEHEMRMRHYQMEHEARMRAYKVSARTTAMTTATVTKAEPVQNNVDANVAK